MCKALDDLYQDGVEKGIELEHVQTEKEKRRADEAEAGRAKAEAELAELRARLAQYETA